MKSLSSNVIRGQVRTKSLNKEHLRSLTFISTSITLRDRSGQTRTHKSYLITFNNNFAI
jgi:hypothetical protein